MVATSAHLSTCLTSGSQDVPHLETSLFDQSLLQRLKGFPNEFKDFFEHLKYSILLPLSWFLTMFKFCRALIWRFLVSGRVPLERAQSDLLPQTMPLRLFINFYEVRVRQRFPWLPSIWGILFRLFPGGIKLPTFTSLTAGPFKGAGPIGKNPTLDVDIDAIIAGNQPNGTTGATGNSSGPVGNGNSSSQVNTHRSKLENALKNITTFSPADLDTGLEKVKVRTPSNLPQPKTDRFPKGCTSRSREFAKVDRFRLNTLTRISAKPEACSHLRQCSSIRE